MPCRRQSSSPDGKPSHFFKLLLPITILDEKLRVPRTFVNYHGDDFSNTVTLHDPNGREWRIGLEKGEEDFFFSKGWDKFVEYYSISNECFIVFRYEGDSRFHVLIFDMMSGSEIEYPPNMPTSPETNPPAASLRSSKSNNYGHGGIGDDDFSDENYTDDEDAYKEDDLHYSISMSNIPSTKKRGFTKFVDQSSRRKRHSSPSPPPKRNRHEHSSGSGSEEESDGVSNDWRKRRRRRRVFPVERGRTWREKKANNVLWLSKQTLKSKTYKKRNISDIARERVIQEADNYISEDIPSFRTVMRPHNLYNSIAYVPARFAVKHMKGRSGKIRLENTKGKQWEARCLCKSGSGNAMSIGEGWAKFRMDNEVKEGDVCVFELINKRDIVLRVKIFRVRKYIDR